MFNPMDLTGKKILVTGATGGIGEATAIYLSRLGAQLVIVGRTKEKLAETKSKLEGDEHQELIADLCEFDSIPDFIKKSLDIDGKKFNGFVHCAGGGKIIPLRVLTLKALNDAMQVNYFAFVEIVRNITMKKYFDGGSIIGISSYAAMEGEAGNTAYSGAKAAMDASVRTLSYELADKEIRINSVRPGMIYTNATKKYEQSMPSEQYEKLVAKQLLGMGKPDDIAGMCAFLLSDASKFITGRNIYVDGGRFK